MKKLIEHTCLMSDGKTVCFTGPRPKDIFMKYPYAESRRSDYQQIVTNLKELVEDLYQQGYRTFVTGGAQGFDQLAFWAVHALQKKYTDIVNVLAVPFVEQERLWSETGLFSKQEYRLMRTKADKIIVCTVLEFNDVGTSLLYRNKVMVALADLVVGMAKDDTWMNVSTRGGTAHCLRYAKEKGKKMIVKWF